MKHVFTGEINKIAKRIQKKNYGQRKQSIDSIETYAH